jgi:dihydrofolate synthase/folylpolyglutamate synthase
MSGMPAYQQRNWLLAYRTYRFLQERDQLPQLSPKDLADSQDLQVPVRMERLKVGSKTIVMDGAHNAQKMEAFVQSFRKLYPGIQPAILISLKQGKDFQGVVPILASLASRIIVTTFKTTQDLPVKSMDPSKLANAFKTVSRLPVQIIADQQTALDALLAGDEVICVITGSFYLLSQLRRSRLLA